MRDCLRNLSIDVVRDSRQALAPISDVTKGEVLRQANEASPRLRFVALQAMRLHKMGWHPPLQKSGQHRYGRDMRQLACQDAQAFEERFVSE